MFERGFTWRLIKGTVVTAMAFGILGTVSALWENPLFVRMTPAGEWEIVLLAALAILTGVYFAMPRRVSADGTAGTGGVLGFVGIACPVCNKVLLLIFGGEILLTYFEPVRLYLAAVGVLILGWAVIQVWRRNRPDLPTAETATNV